MINTSSPSPLYIPVFEKEEGIKAFFSTKAGASAKSPYHNLQVLDQMNPENFPLIWPVQVHKDHISIIDNTQITLKENIVPDTDGLITNVPGVFLTTVHADCLALFFYDKKQKAIGLVHAGWRGSALGIGVKAVTLMTKEYGSRPSDILCFISPGISSCCFETGPEVLDTFLTRWSFAKEFAKKSGEKYYLDLKGINRRQLELIGVNNIEVSDTCTACHPDLYCSYRKDKLQAKRMGAGICLLP